MVNVIAENYNIILWCYSYGFLYSFNNVIVIVQGNLREWWKNRVI